MDISDKQFNDLISEALDSLPQEHVKNLKNVAIVYEDEPSPDQRTKLKLHCNETLLGLYEGPPAMMRPALDSPFGGPIATLPSKITLFKFPLINNSAGSMDKLKENIRHTLWHEIAHFYGLDHEQIHKKEK